MIKDVAAKPKGVGLKSAGALLAASCLLAGLALLAALPAGAQQAIGAGVVKGVYAQYCASCHGAVLEGGSGGSLIDGAWSFGGDDASIAAAIREGRVDAGMPGFAEALSEEQIRALVILIREKEHLAETQPPQQGLAAAAGARVETALHDFTLEPVLEHDGLVWSLAFLPDGAMLATVRDGALLHRSPSGQVTTVSGTPQVWVHGQGGLLDVAVHPDYAENGWLYLAYAASPGGARASVGGLSVVRGRVREGRWVDEELIFETPAAFQTPARHHFGTRLVLHAGYVFFSIGDRGRPANSQDIIHPAGKLHRLHDDGRLPEDNPFVSNPDAFASIWSWGHRNPQGLARSARDGALYLTEHGPRGGDELNRVERGLNYGWPTVTHGMNYAGTPISAETEAPGLQPSLRHWTPSLGVSTLAIAGGAAFPDWNGDLLVGGLATRDVRRVRLENGVVAAEEVLMAGYGRVRDVVLDGDGAPHVVLNSADGGLSLVLRLQPITP